MKSNLGELSLIERIRSEWGASGRTGHGRARGVILGIGDDCAILHPPKGNELLVTTDFTLEGSHFRRDWHPPESVGHRTLARGPAIWPPLALVLWQPSSRLPCP